MFNYRLISVLVWMIAVILVLIFIIFIIIIIMILMQIIIMIIMISNDCNVPRVFLCANDNLVHYY